MGTFFKCSRCGNEDPVKIGYKNGKPYCRACISFRGAAAIETNYKPNGYKIYIDYELSKEQKELSDEIKIDVYVSLIKEQRKNGGKLTNEALTQKGHTPSISIKSKHKKKGKKNGKL